MSPDGPIIPSVGVHESWYALGDQLADLAIATFPTSGAAPLPSVTPSSANHAANPAPPRSATSLANRASSSNSNALPEVIVGSARGFGTLEEGVGSSNWPYPGRAANRPQATTPAQANLFLVGSRISSVFSPTC